MLVLTYLNGIIMSYCNNKDKGCCYMHIYKSKKLRKDGVRWGYNISFTDKLTGKNKRITKETFRTKKEAETAARRMLQKIEDGEYDPFDTVSNYRVVDIFDDFVNHYSKTGVTESTVRIMKQGMRKHFVGWFGDAYIKKIKTNHLDDFFVD